MKEVIILAFQIIPIDTGRHGVKLLNGESFKSVVGDWHHREISDNEEYEVIINDKEKYFVGQLALDESYAPTEMTTKSKIHLQTKILFLTGVAISLEENDSELYVCTGVPIDQFNVATKTALENLLLGKYDIQINGKHKKFCIDNLNIAPESVASFQYALSKDESLAVGKKRIIDIGSLTVNAASFKGEKFITRDSNTIHFGTVKLKDNQIDNEQYVSKIVAEISQIFTDYDPSDRVLLTGGGALQFGDLFKKHYPNCSILDNCVYANVEGYYRMSIKRWSKLKASANSQAE